METSIHAIDCNNLLIIFATIATAGIVCSKASDLIKVPDVVLFLIVGIFLGPSVLDMIDISQLKTLLILLHVVFLPLRRYPAIKGIKTLRLSEYNGKS